MSTTIEATGEAVRPAGSTNSGALMRAARAVRRFNDWYMHDIPLGPKAMQPRQVINLHKFMVGPVVLALMVLTDHWSLTAWIYLALHGTYGLMWVAKDVAFGDPSWQGKTTIGSSIACFIFPLAGYFLAPLCILTPLGTAVPGGWGTPETLPLSVAFAAVLLFVVGAFFHFVADAQKYYVLKHQRPRRLITDGMFSLTRNPNYFGEILMYSAFNLLAQHWLPWALCGLVWLQVFLVNMLHKEASMSRYAEHAAWKARTGFLFPSVLGLLRKAPLGLRRTP